MIAPAESPAAPSSAHDDLLSILSAVTGGGLAGMEPESPAPRRPTPQSTTPEVPQNVPANDSNGRPAELPIPVPLPGRASATAGATTATRGPRDHAVPVRYGTATPSREADSDAIIETDVNDSEFDHESSADAGEVRSPAKLSQQRKSQPAPLPQRRLPTELYDEARDAADGPASPEVRSALASQQIPTPKLGPAREVAPLAEEFRSLRRKYKSCVNLLRRSERSRQGLQHKLASVRSVAQEARVAADLEVQEARQQVLEMRKALRASQAGADVSEIFERYERDIQSLSDENQVLYAENAQLRATGSTAPPRTASTASLRPTSPALSASRSAARLAPASVAALKTQVRKAEETAKEARDRASDLEGRERQWMLTARRLSDAEKKLQHTSSALQEAERAVLDERAIAARAADAAEAAEAENATLRRELHRLRDDIGILTVDMQALRAQSSQLRAEGGIEFASARSRLPRGTVPPKSIQTVLELAHKARADLDTAAAPPSALRSAEKLIRHAEHALRLSNGGSASNGSAGAASPSHDAALDASSQRGLRFSIHRLLQIEDALLHKLTALNSELPSELSPDREQMLGFDERD
jgi:predicted  nucleic acid-binding Zn-ribbon protein